MELTMPRKTRAKITKDNYEGLSAIAKAHPKNQSSVVIREALNVSSGTWSYLARSKDFNDFMNFRKEESKQALARYNKVQKKLDPQAPADPNKFEGITATHKVITDKSDAQLLTRIAVALERLADAWEKPARNLQDYMEIK